MAKSGIIFVAGLGLILLLVFRHLNGAAPESALWYDRAMVHDIAAAGAEIGSSMLLNDPGAVADIVNRQFAGGEFTVRFAIRGDSATVSSYATFVGAGGPVDDTVIATFRHTPLARFAWFTESEVHGYAGSPYFNASDWKISGDSLFGEAHTNGHFNLAGEPYFHDRVTAAVAPVIRPLNGVRGPVYRAGHEWALTIPRPARCLDALEQMAAASGALLDIQSDVAFHFLADGAVGVRIPPASGSLRNDTVSLAALAPRGVVAVKGGDLRISGVYRGRITVVALQGSAEGKGNVWIDGSGIVAARNPENDVSSGDILGIVCENSAYISRDQRRTGADRVSIQAAVYCQRGELTARDFWLLRPSGAVKLYGGVSQNRVGSMGVYGRYGLEHGMYYSIRYDPRFKRESPPGFPVSDRYELVSWWED